MLFFEYDFMLRAFAAGMILAVAAPAVGIFLVARRYSLMADTLAHVSLLGVAAGFIARSNPLATSMLTAALAAIGMESLKSQRKIFGESVMALFLSGSLALAVVLISLAKRFNAQLLHFLFGSITTVQTTDLAVMAAVGAAVLLVITILYKELVLISIDEEYALGSGVNVRLTSMLLMVAAAVLIAISIRVVGVLLIGALMVIPVISAVQFGKNFKTTLGLSVFFSVLSVLAGLIASFYLNIASGGSIVLGALLIFIASTFINSKFITRLFSL